MTSYKRITKFESGEHKITNDKNMTPEQLEKVDAIALSDEELNKVVGGSTIEGNPCIKCGKERFYYIGSKIICCATCGQEQEMRKGIKPPKR